MKPTATTHPLDRLEPQAVWRYFADIAAVPRPSKHEEKIRAHLRALAGQLGFPIQEDARGNLRVDVPASPGCERAAPVVLQGHVDMVCEKNAGTRHDFDTDGIRLVIDTDANGEAIVRADGTTLGADNGIGVALALAAATDPDLVHGPLEILLTVDEEAGMTGADALTPGSFKSRRLINLDSEEDGVLYIGCAGGCDVNMIWDLPTQPAGGLQAVRVGVSGLRGGHSGGDIHENRGNANKLLVRALLGADAKDFRIAAIQGGSKRNAIPREAHADICLPAGDVEALRQSVRRLARIARSESGETQAELTVEACDAPSDGALLVADTRRVLCALAAVPSGVLGMHRIAPGLVETSNNLSTVETRPFGKSGLQIVAGALVRSSSESRLQEVVAQLTAIGSLAGAEVTLANRYPGWDPDPESALLARCRRVYAEKFGEEPKVAAIHAGLECGIIGQRVGKMEMISFGPRIEGAHSPDERVWVDSVARTWTYLRAVLTALAR